MVEASKLRDAIESLKKQGHVSSNLYSEDIIARADEIVTTPETVLLSYEDHTVRRLYYYTIHISNLAEAVARLSHNSYVIEFMTRDPSENREPLLQAGFKPLSALLRMSVRDCSAAFQNLEISAFYDRAIGKYPDESEAPEINRVLWNVFDTRVSHLCTDEEIAAAICRREITVHKNEKGHVEALLQAVVNPKKFYINQVYNGSEKRIIHAILLNRLKEYCEAGGKYAYAWVAEDNIASIKFHQKYGFTPDGMWNMVYCLES